MARLWESVTFRIALIYGVLVVASLTVISIVFYFGTVQIQSRTTDQRLITSSASLTSEYKAQGAAGMQREIEHLLNDGVYQDTEVYQLLDPMGRKLAGNLTAWPAA